MNTDTKQPSAVEMLLDKINYMMSTISALEYRICELERKANQLQIQISNVAYTWSYNDLTDAPNIPTNISDIYNTYITNRAYCTSIGNQPERYVTDIQSQNWDLVIQFSDGTTAHLNDEWL